MTAHGDETRPDAIAARARIALAVGLALLVSGITLVVGVLPAEFGVDPTGLGRRFGLLALSDVKTQLAQFEQARDGRPPLETVTPQTQKFQQETVAFVLVPGEFVEYQVPAREG